MSSNSNQSQESNNLFADFQRILQLYDRETAIYKAQISILKDTLETLQTNDTNLITTMTSEIQNLRRLVNDISTLTLTSVALPTSNSNNITEAELVIPSISSESLQQPQTSQYRQISDYLCQICLDKPRDCILEPCMHFCLCANCVSQLPETKCPICRRPIEFYQNVFIS